MAPAPDPADLLAGPATSVAPALLGALITSGSGSEVVTVRLTEVEAYEGAADAASHAFRGRTNRNNVMFGPPGELYVYFVYGMHWCANVVCGPDGTASAVLLRAGAVVEGLAVARRRRPAARSDRQLARGPARLAQCLALGRDDYGRHLLDPASPVRLALPAVPLAMTDVGVGPRVGVAAARQASLRFWVLGDATVSDYRPGRGQRRGDRAD